MYFIVKMYLSNLMYYYSLCFVGFDLSIIILKQVKFEDILKWRFIECQIVWKIGVLRVKILLKILSTYQTKDLMNSIANHVLATLTRKCNLSHLWIMSVYLGDPLLVTIRGCFQEQSVCEFHRGSEVCFCEISTICGRLYELLDNF